MSTLIPWTEEDLILLADLSHKGHKAGEIHQRYFPTRTASSVGSAISRAKKKYSSTHFVQPTSQPISSPIPPIIPPQIASSASIPRFTPPVDSLRCMLCILLLVILNSYYFIMCVCFT